MKVQSFDVGVRVMIRLIVGALFLVGTGLLMSATHGTAIASQAAQQLDQSDIVIELIETGEDDDSDVVEDVLVFRVRAYDSSEGDDDGDGIDYVDMIILNEDGDEVYRKRESIPGYCAFGEGDPDCIVWDFNDHNGDWPNGDPLEEGEHTLRARVQPESGQAVMQDFIVDIFLSN